jgi:prephenate dehydrogenase
MSENIDFGTIVIVGVGLLGGSIGKALLLGNQARRIIGVGRSSERLTEAVRLGAITEFTTSLAEVAGIADIIVLCTPVSNIVRDLPDILRLAGSGTTVTDVGSVKSAITEASAGDSRFVGGHPMAGSEQTGVVASRPDLFNDATWALTPLDATEITHFNRVRDLAQQLGAATIILSPKDHDQAVAVTSHLPHAIATSLMRLADKNSETAPEIQRLTAGSFADATRVAASSASLWADIFRFNREAIIKALTDYRGEIDGFLNDLNEDNSDALRERFASGSDAKHSWSKL